MTPKRLAMLVATALLAVVGFVGYVWLLHIDKRDIYAFNDIEFAFTPRPTLLRPGDIVEVDAQNNVAAICHFAGTRGALPPEVHEVYYNRYHESYDDFLSLVGKLNPKHLFDAEAGDDLSDPADELREIAFRGRRHAPERISTGASFDRSDCDTLMARVWNTKGSKVCVVIRAINEVRADETGALRREVVAVRFKPATLVPSLHLAEAGWDQDRINEALGRSCHKDTLPWDVRLRDRLRAIGMREIQTASVQ